MATTTSNLGLTKPDYTDAADVGVFNGNFDLIDQAIAEDRVNNVRHTNVHNLLDNSDFRNPVNQRKESSYTTAGDYSIDRWFLRTGATLTVNSGSITVTGKIKQRLLNAKQGGVYTLAVGKADGTVQILTTHGWDSSASRYYVEISDGEYIWAALYEGSYTAETLPPYVPKDAELVECMRHFQRIRLGNGYLSCVNFSASSARTVLFIPEMRITPTITAANWFRLYDLSSKGYCEVTSASISAMDANTCLLTLASSGLTNNGMSVVYPESNTTYLEMDLSADL